MSGHNGRRTRALPPRIGRIFVVVSALVLVIVGTFAYGNPASHDDDRSIVGQGESIYSMENFSTRVNLIADGNWSWAITNRSKNDTAGSENSESFANSTESMIKAWIAADYLAQVEQEGRQPNSTELDLLTRMVRESDDGAAEELYQARGGDAVIARLIGACKLTDTTIVSGLWADTQMSARDAALMGSCIANGDSLSETWTSWLLSEMRQVVPSNAFGIAEAPALVGKDIAIKNGWTLREDGTWAVNCLAMWDEWSLAVLTNYSGDLGFAHGANICQTVAQQLFVLCC